MPKSKIRYYESGDIAEETSYFYDQNGLLERIESNTSDSQKFFVFTYDYDEKIVFFSEDYQINSTGYSSSKSHEVLYNGDLISQICREIQSDINGVATGELLIERDNYICNNNGNVIDGYYGSICATHFGRLVPVISV